MKYQMGKKSVSTLKDKLREIVRDAFDSQYFVGGKERDIDKYLDNILAILLSSILAELPEEKGVWKNKYTGKPVSSEILRLGETYIFDNEARIHNECLAEVRARITKLLGGTNEY